MTEPTQFTAEQAVDPATPAQALADMAALRPDLRPAVAANPSAYPGLVEWLGSLGEPAVDAALAERAAREQAAAAQPAAGWVPTAGASAPEQQPGEQQSWQGQAGQGQAGQPAPGQQQPWPGQPGQPGPQQPWQGQPGQQQAWQGQPGQPAPGQPYGYQPAGTPPKSNGKKVLIIVAIVLGVLLLLGVGAAFAVRAIVGNVVDTASSAAETMFTSGQEYGDDAELDALWDQCEAENWSACDELYFVAPFDSAYETFGSSCGGRADEAAGGCAVLNGEEPTTDPDSSSVEGASTYGDDAELDALWDACDGGDMGACDDLYFESPFGSEYERFGDSCGGTREEGLGEFCNG